MFDILKECNNEPHGGHFVDKRATYKVLHLGYFCPTIFQDAKKYVKSCDNYQQMGKLVQVDEMPLHP